MPSLDQHSSLEDFELKRMNSALNSLVFKLLLIVKKYMKANLTSTERVFELSLMRKNRCSNKGSIYSFALKVCEEYFMRDFIEEIFKLCSSPIKERCHMRDSNGKGLYLIDIWIVIPEPISEKMDTAMRIDKYLLEHLMPICSMLQVEKGNFWLPHSWESILISAPFDDGLSYSYDYDWCPISIADIFDNDSSYEYTNARLKRVKMIYHLLAIYIRVFEEYMKAAFPEERYDLSYEATRL